MIRLRSWLGQAAQKSLTTWTLAFSVAVHSAASAEPDVPITPAKPIPAVVTIERREMLSGMLDLQLSSAVAMMVGLNAELIEHAQQKIRHGRVRSVLHVPSALQM